MDTYAFSLISGWYHYVINGSIIFNTPYITLTSSLNERNLFGKYELNFTGAVWSIDIPEAYFMHSTIFLIYGITIGY